MELQEAIERFLSDTERRRSEVTVKRYGEAMDLLQSHLALELIDPDAPGEPSVGTVEDLTPAAVGSFVNDFLVRRLRSNGRSRRRYVAATRSFVQWLIKTNLLPSELGKEILEVLRLSARQVAMGEAASEGGMEGQEDDAPWDWEAQEGERFFHVLEVQDRKLLLLDLSSADTLRGEVPRDEMLGAGDLVAGVLAGEGDVARVVDVRLVASSGEVESDDLPSEYWDEEWDEEWETMVQQDLEDALEILASEDRFAPREVIRTILASMEEAKDDLLDWLSDDAYRNEPIPGAGEAPANAARLLSEARDEDALPRLLSVLGAGDPLGEEAPMAVARYGLAVAAPLVGILHDGHVAVERRVAALWALAFLTARNPALRASFGELVLDLLPGEQPRLKKELLETVEELRLVEVSDSVLELSRQGDLDLEALDMTEDLLDGRVRSEGWGERVGESLLPVILLYPTGEDLQDFYQSLEEDLGELWEIVGEGDEGDEDDEDDYGDYGDYDDGGGGHGDREGGAGGEDGGEGVGGSKRGGKVIPFRRPTP